MNEFDFKKFCEGGLFLLAGPCVIESLDTCLKVANFLATLQEKHKIQVFFKSSYDKAKFIAASMQNPSKHFGVKKLEKCILHRKSSINVVLPCQNKL